MKKNCLLAGLLSLAILPSFAGTKIACVGDSITYGSGISNRETNSYPYFLQKLLGDGYEVVNFGNPGKTAGDFPGQVGRWYGSTREHQEAVAFEGDIYVCNLGINDTGVWWNAGLFVQGYQNLIDQWRGKRKDVPVIIWTRLGPDFRGEPGKKAFPGNVFPERKYSAKDNGSSAKRGEAEKLLQKIARKKKTLTMDAYAAMASHPEWYKDGLHPMAPGARRIAQLTCSALYRLRPWRQAAPVIRVDETRLTLTNESARALVLDHGTLKGGPKQSVIFVFGEGSVLGPGESATIRLNAEATSADFGSPLATKAAHAENAVFVPAGKTTAETHSRIQAD